MSALPAFSVAGSGSTTLVFLHGVGGGKAAWQPQLDHFGARGYRAVAWDQPGYGESASVAPYDLERVAAALEALLGHLGREPAVLVGHSMGGFIAQEALARFAERVRAAALCFTSAAFGARDREFANRFVAERIGALDNGASMAEVAARLIPGLRGSRSDSAGLRRAEQVMAAVPPQTYRAAVRMLTTFDRRALLPEIRVPTLLLAGDEDRTAPADMMARMAQKIPGSEYRCLEQCGHLGPMDQPASFNRALEAFLGRHGL